jgi:UPF0755 protein
MGRLFKFFGWALIFMGALAVCGGLIGWRMLEGRWNAPGPNPKERVVFIPRGSSTENIAARLTQEDFILEGWSMQAALRLLPDTRPLRAGEYEIPARASLLEVLEILRSGREFSRRVTIPEGLTTQQTIALIRAAEMLEQDSLPMLAEGTLLPDTYSYVRGDRASDLVKRMRQAMEAAVSEAWRGRRQTLPLATPADLVTLASVVEKETGVAEERGLVAGVFINRLRLGMRLQSDPTVIYGITKGAGPLDRGLTRRDLDTDTPWNSYTRDGLPPSPIATPGRAALLATANPAETDALYFVADGTGGHAFAKTLAEHNRNVARWRKIEADRRPR